VLNINKSLEVLAGLKYNLGEDCLEELLVIMCNLRRSLLNMIKGCLNCDGKEYTLTSIKEIA
jgi:hypothetical protein